MNVNGHGNQVALGSEGDVSQEISEQEVSTQPVDRDATLAAVRDLLHHMKNDGIQIEDETFAAELHSDATDLQTEAETDEPDQSQMRQLATRIGEKLSDLPVNALGGFTAQLLANAFLPPAS